MFEAMRAVIQVAAHSPFMLFLAWVLIVACAVSCFTSRSK